MTIALIAALAAVVIANTWLVDRLLKRHAAQIDRLLHWRADPAGAAVADAPTAEVLYLKPEDDKAWNEQHRAAE